jgi:hypothetical protein
LNIRLFHVKGPDWVNPRFDKKWAKQCKEAGIVVPSQMSLRPRDETGKVSVMKKAVASELKTRLTAQKEKLN